VTKLIRVENADNSEWKVVAHVEDQQPDGSWIRVKSLPADYPTALVSEYITATRRLVIEEAK
jgi:hypothetical protein